jgi:hypothetical protein
MVESQPEQDEPNTNNGHSQRRDLEEGTHNLHKGT